MRYVLYLLILLGIGYGAYSIFRGDEEPAPLAANAANSGEAEVSDASTEAEEPAPAQPSVEALVAEAEKAIARAQTAVSRSKAQEDLDEARRKLSTAYLALAASGEGEELRQRLEGLNEQVFDSEEPIPGKSVLYTIRANDRLWTLCNTYFPKEYGVRIDPGFLCWLNGVSDPRRIREGQNFKIPLEELSLLVSKSRHRLWVLLGGVYVKEFPVGLGLNDKTPEGMFEIETKIKEPDWYFDGRRVAYGDPKNPLGTRWMGFVRTRRAAGYGIHGTDEPETVGKSVSQGCVRMLNAHAEQLFGWVPRGTKVRIVR
jgi:L,D-transpeptidase catalytic domain